MENKNFILRILAVLSLVTIFYCLYLYLNPYTIKITEGYIYKIDRVSGQVWRQEQNSNTSNFEIISEGKSRIPIILGTSVVVFFISILLMATNLEKARILRKKYLPKKKIITTIIVIALAYATYGLYAFASLKPGDRFQVFGIKIYEKPYLQTEGGTLYDPGAVVWDKPGAPVATAPPMGGATTATPSEKAQLVPVEYDPFSSLEAYKQKLTEGMPDAIEVLHSSEFRQWLHDNSKWGEVKQADDSHNYIVVLKALKDFKKYRAAQK